MKISDIVKVNIDGKLVYSANSAEMNSTAAVLYVSQESGTTDTAWIDYTELGTGYNGEALIERIGATYFANGGISLIVKRIYLNGTPDVLGDWTNAIYGAENNEALPVNVKNIQLAWNETPAIGIRAIAQATVSTSNPDQSKILFVTANSAPADLDDIPNVFWHYATSTSFTNYYESAAAMAYLSKINYSDDVIRDYEYTVWAGGANLVNRVADLDISEDGGRVNYFVTLANRTVLINGVMTNGVRLVTHYFEEILTERITNLLGLLTIQKLNFDQSTYSYLYNVLTIELDKFATNGLLNTEFVVPEDRVIFRDDVRYVLAQAGDIMEFGYVVRVLPPTANDILARNYTGIYILLAFANQIRTIDVTGLVLGGVQ